MSENHPEVVIGRGSNNFVAITVLGRMHPGAVDYWDGNWLRTPIRVAAGDFRAKVDAGLRAEELRDFRDDLQRLHALAGGEATFESMEEWLTLHVTTDAMGHLQVRGRVTDRPGGPDVLSFEIEGLDQSDLPPVIEALSQIEALFPVLGKP